ncbi:AAA family ATPase [Gallionella capsiferriformans]|uniref:AAA ATPase n=1 Tax=Gallionella capsiferriformans (strain ES-2) TaxID=395494 RepID=D9SGA5_GALCS|nr:AAA family ATPase [Gallionella capsiferriformans]ADL55552.1 hypothetical protein Galf_1533 [Gallionella capsiferriformans ES-2]
MKKFHSSALLAKPAKPISYIVDRLMPAGGILDVSGPPGEGKSTIILSLASSISTGSSWFGLAVKKSKAAWISGESSDGDAINRDLTRLNVSEKSDITFFLPERELFKFDTRSQCWITTTEGRAVLDEVKSAGIEFLVFDTVGSVISGSKEIDNDQQRQLARHIRSETLGITTATLGHTNQASAREEINLRLHYLSKAGGSGFPGAVRWASGVSQVQHQDATTLGISEEVIGTKKLVGFGVSKHNEIPSPVWTNRRPAVFEIKPDGALVLFKDGREIQPVKKSKDMKCKEVRSAACSF